MGALINPDAEELEEFSRHLDIVDHRTGARTKWPVNVEQRHLWQEGEGHNFLYALKPRQIGISTSESLKDLVFTVINAANGNSVETWLVWDTDTKVRSKIEVIQDFARQLRIPFRRRDNALLFDTAGGGRDSAIHGVTAGGNRVGAGMTAHRLHMSELPAWQRASDSYNSLRQSLVLEGQAVIETTMLLGQELPKRLWYDPRNEWRQVFFGVEMHEEYRRDPDTFDPHHPDLPEGRLREMGFTRLDSMAFIQWALANACDGDVFALGREYPQTAAQAFESAMGRWVRVTPEVTTERGHVLDTGYTVRVYAEPHETSAQLSMGIDTAGDTQGDRSAIALVDHRDNRIVASLVAEEMTTDELALSAKELHDMYTIDVPAPPWMVGVKPKTHAPAVVIESNGIGQSTCQRAKAHGLPHNRYTARAGQGQRSTTYEMLLRAKQGCESGACYGPPELAEECDGLSYVDGKYNGKKDLLVALGIALTSADRGGYIPPETQPPDNVFAAPKLNKRRRW